MLVLTSLIRAGDGATELCREGADELSDMTSPDVHTVVCALNDSSSSPMTRMCYIQKITSICMKIIIANQ
jgi:hypothetical protein